MTEPWPLERWPDVPTRFVLAPRRPVLPRRMAAQVVRDRLGIEPDEIDGGHCVALSRPQELVELLEAIRGV